MNVLFETRFSFFGQSGWKSAHAADPDLLFAADRLEARLKLFEKITLKSLSGQTDGKFRILVLSSTLMPQPYQTRLNELCQDVLGKDRARVIFRPEGSAGHIFRNTVGRVYGDKQVAQVVLDDDDAVSVDFVEMLRKYARMAQSDPYNEKPYTFVSFPRGHTLGLENGAIKWLSPRYVPYTNLGLALVGPGNAKKNPFLTSHKKIGMRQPSFMVTHMRPYYLRAVHGLNDSNAHADDQHLNADEIAKVIPYFPWLGAHFPHIRPASDLAAQ
ncbi:MAG: glycosyltransferase [Maritimibacter sp.]